MRFDKNKAIMIGIIALLLVVLTVLTIIAVTGIDDKNYTPTPSGTNSTTEPTQSGDDELIQTPYGDIVFPGKWVDYLVLDRTTEPELRLDFAAELPSGKSQNLFTIRFGEPVEPAVGQLTSDNGVVVGVYVTVYEFSPDGTWSVKETTIVEEMQEALNDVLNSLNPAPLGTVNPDVDRKDVVIQTPHCKLYFPGQWAEELTTAVDESDGYEVVFRGKIGDHEAIDLFAISFGGSKGTQVHTLYTENGVPYYVRLRTFALDLEGWSSVDQATARAMQEDLNHVLTKLREE